MKKLTSCLFTKDHVLSEKVLKCVQTFELIENIDVYASQAEMIEKTVQQKPMILFIDIDNTDLNAGDILKLIQRPPFIIGITKKKDIIPELLDNGYFDFMTAKFDLNYFCKKMSKVLNITTTLNITKSLVEESTREYRAVKSTPKKCKKSIFITYKKIDHKVDLDDIIYITNAGNYLRIERTKGPVLYHASSLKKFADMLPHDYFSRINKSIIINHSRVDKIEKNKVFINGKAFAVSRIYMNVIKDLKNRKA